MMKRANGLATLGTIVLIAAFSCATAPGRSAPGSGAPQADDGQASAPRAGESGKGQSGSRSDYLGADLRLCGLQLFSWMGTPYTMPFFPSKVLQAPSAATKGEGKIAPVIRVPDRSETEFWTAWIVESAPAVLSELKPGDLVLTQGEGEGEGRAADNLRGASWNLRRVKDLSESYKSVVIVEYYDTYYNSWRESRVHPGNMRIVLSPLDPGV